MNRRSLLAGAIAAPMLKVEAQGEPYDARYAPRPCIETTHEPERFGIWVTAWAADPDPDRCAKGWRIGIRTFVVVGAGGDDYFKVAQAAQRVTMSVKRGCFVALCKLNGVDPTWDLP